MRQIILKTTHSPYVVRRVDAYAVGNLEVTLAPGPHDCSVAVENDDGLGLFATLYFVNRSLDINGYPEYGTRFPPGCERLCGKMHTFEGQHRRRIDSSKQLR
jgi:hypothetical protein